MLAHTSVTSDLCKIGYFLALPCSVLQPSSCACLTSWEAVLLRVSDIFEIMCAGFQLLQRKKRRRCERRATVACLHDPAVMYVC